ncbi:ABC transporter permease [Arthrobacter sp. CC3]|uniref:ABC transporter permease n=1 Tax=Arthrobacter sp. CC3 TaxID=3029185 RepID=UPI00326573AE
MKMIPGPSREKVTSMAETAPLTSPSWTSRALQAQAVPIGVATVVLILVASIFVPQVLTPASLVAVIIPAAIMAIAAIGQTLVVQQKGIDLSVGGSMTLSAGIVATSTANGQSIWLGLVLATIAAVVAGVANGLLVTRLHITPILATLASNSLLIGAVWTVSNGNAQTTPDALRAVATGSAAGLPFIGWIAIVLVAGSSFVMAKSVYGRRFTAVGAAPEAARASGTSVEVHVVSAYVASSISGALAGLLLAAYAGQATYDLGNSYMLSIVAVVVIGGAVLSGGRGSITATAIAGVLLALVVQMVLTLGAPPSTQLLVQSIVLGLAAVARLVPWTRFVRR